MNKSVAVRVDEATIRAVDAVRDPTLYPTQSDFVREAIRRMIREERRRRVAAEIDENMRDLAEVSLANAIAEENAADMGNHLDGLAGSDVTDG